MPNMISQLYKTFWLIKNTLITEGNTTILLIHTDLTKIEKERKVLGK